MKHKKYFSKSNDPLILAYVEDIDDTNFWNEIFDNYSPIRIRPTTNKGSADGKIAIMKNLQNTGKDIIVCRDSDLDYLLPNRSPDANIMNNHICVFHTYTFAMENYRCYAEGLGELCKRISRNHNPAVEFDFQDFFDKYSGKIYEPFIYVLYFSDLNDEDTISLIDFENLVKIERKKLTANNVIALKKILAEIIEDMEYKLIEKVIDLDVDDQRLEKLRLQLDERDLERSKTYLFICGHTLLDDVIKPLVDKIVAIYGEEERNKIRERFKDHPKQCSDSLNHYQGLLKQTTIRNHLKTNTEFHECYLIEKIKADIDIFIQKYYPEYINTV